jgi:muramoyltetrapeptide carboxypeptidase
VKRPPKLNKGDKIGIVAPARKISLTEIEKAISLFEEHGFQMVFHPELFETDNQFAGSDEVRAACFQELLDDDGIKAIISARGGYGSVRIIDKLDFTGFAQNPKWVIGYSDVTVFHSHLNKVLGIESLHAGMLLGFENNTKQSMDGLAHVLYGISPEYKIASNPLNKTGSMKAQLVGGNLSVLYSLLGSVSFPDTKGKILFLEDLDEYLYHIDRMMMGLKRAGVFNGLKGLVVGGMTDMNDNKVPFGKTAEEIISEHFREFDFPVCFNFPAGHIPDNRPLIMGAKIELKVGESVSLTFN